VEVAGEVVESEIRLLAREGRVGETDKAVLRVRAKLTDAGMAVAETDRRLRSLQNGVRGAA
jgi:hypothetical protein